ncbi:MAG: hypothetical protein A2808_00450 [Candidatus Moranbacteria bacterium RIFCSPHIGHO2_01_FULL_55_24]|nr:MAG: hypothetical protein A2808_00450 [Candidatus Moranbacteria bacterium RIFCSPHIGHO2_01_FULL_55_24]
MGVKTEKHLKIYFLTGLFLFLGGFFYFASFVLAADSSVTGLSKEAEKELADKEDKLAEINAKIKAYKQIIDLKNRQGATLNDQIQALEAQAAKLELEIGQNKEKVESLQGEIGTLSSRVNEKTLLVEKQKKMLSELMRDYYASYNSDVSPFLLTAEESFSYFNQSSWNSDIGERISDLLDSVKTLREGLVAEQQSLEEKKQQADTLLTQLAERNDYLESTKGSKASLLAKTQSEAEKYDDLVDDLQKQREELESEIEGLEAGKIDDLASLPGYKKGMLAYPVKSVSISQGYGKTSFSKKAYASGKHNGIDFTGSSGTTIMAAANGRVVGTGDLGRYAYGKWVAIDHGNGIVTLYGHLRKISVSRGQSVEEGEKIGEMGSTGYSTGTHVHFTVFASKSYEVVSSTKVKGLKIPIGASVNPKVYLP